MQKTITEVDEISGELSSEEAELAGAFVEDALSEADARDSVDDEALTPAEALNQSTFSKI